LQPEKECAHSAQQDNQPEMEEHAMFLELLVYQDKEELATHYAKTAQPIPDSHLMVCLVLHAQLDKFLTSMEFAQCAQ